MIEENAADRLEGAPHPREREILIGQQAAEQQLLDAYRGPRMPHAWLIGGPGGIGKATLAYRFARFVLANPRPAAVSPGTTDLFLPPDHPVFRRMVAGAHPDLLALRRIAEAGKDKVPQDIPVKLVRDIVRFFGSTAGDGGWRICLVDSADELNRHGANALLKLLEEPPERSLFLIVSHMPGRLLPTIRSRCRMLTLPALAESDIVAGLGTFEDIRLPDDEARRIAARADGSLRRALEAALGGLEEFAAEIEGAIDAAPAIDPLRTHAIGDRLQRRDDDDFEVFLRTVRDHLHRRVALGAGEGARRLAPYAEVWDKVEVAAAQVRTFNLERKPFVFQVFGWLAEAGRRRT
ncbi:MAG: DNA polymerase III subunit delta' [Phreatobacter sp.]|uniref:DNA polymerase III subunit delta' n=1 Tax=Phreatobacter sp. TaxID=1966341 RepID=UPI001A3631FD|nr:DNA polymerase III subunit delta' [Phreatobacter sp.]MBL8569589.1 DNA polymerase III subunit delta' [Phreatobacter sp.]